MSATTADRRSLTLPKLTDRVRRRIRRPRRPGPETWLLVWCLFCVEQAVQQLITGDLFDACLSAAIAGIAWLAYHRVRARQFAFSLTMFAMMVGISIVGLTVPLIWSIH